MRLIRRSPSPTKRAASARSSRTAPIRVVTADDHPLFLEAVGALLRADERIALVGQARDGGEAVRVVTSLQPDVVLLDLDMPVLDGFEATRRIRARVPSARVVVVTGSDDARDVERAREAGAVAYVTKDAFALDLVDAIAALVRDPVAPRPLAPIVAPLAFAALATALLQLLA